MASHHVLSSYLLSISVYNTIHTPFIVQLISIYYKRFIKIRIKKGSFYLTENSFEVVELPSCKRSYRGFHGVNSPFTRPFVEFRKINFFKLTRERSIQYNITVITYILLTGRIYTCRWVSET